MSVLIKGMDMPTACMKDCPFQHFGDCQGGKIKRIMDVEDYEDKRHPRCQLEDVPTPHGRLIDADELREKMLKEVDTYIPYVQDRERRGYHNCELLVDDASTIIEEEM